MPLSVMLSVISILMVIGIISLADALCRLFIKSKYSPDTVIIYINPENTEAAVADAAKKFPASQIIISGNCREKELEIIKRKYPNIKTENII